ncbi:MAG: energy transducer TonB [Bacteroidales bacterium]|nr:energy transducer TonB [Bacteroidales bacterium]
MEIKKNPKADLENKKATFILIGFATILAILFVAFEWTTTNVVKHDDTGASAGLFEEEIVPPTVQDTPPPPPPPPAPALEEVLNIVEDDKEITEVEIASTEDDQNVATEIIAMPEPEPEEEVTNEIFTVVEDAPQFPGGDAALIGFLGKSVKYPVIAQENGIQGRVIVSFVVERDGSITDAQIVRGVDPSLDKEALRVVNSMPKWTPGKQRGKPVRVKFTLPVQFRLQ